MLGANGNKQLGKSKWYFFLFVNNESHTVRKQKDLIEIANFISKKSKDNMVH